MQSLKGKSVDAAIIGIHTLLLIGAVVVVLFVGRDICIPLALSGLLAFLLAPLVTQLERWIGRVAAVLLILITVSGGTGFLGYFVAQQVVDLSVKLPDYQSNIQAKLGFLRWADGPFSRLSRSIDELRKELPGVGEKPLESKSSSKPMLVQIVETRPSFGDNAKAVVGPIISAFTMAGLVLLLSLFMLVRREDLRGRLIRLIGRDRISQTTNAMSEAGDRVLKYLVMQLVVNICYGIPVAIGLYFIGVPNALLWGALAVVLRYIPYIGPWIAAAGPIALSLAVSSDWTMPMLTIGLFVALEIVSNNLMEPWLYSTSTGVSSLALIVAAVFWTWLWGPIGLVLATPLTVCLVVMGRHVPKMEFLSILLSDEEPLKAHQECYLRLLRADLTEGTALVETYLKSNAITSLYDNVLIPALAAAETDYRHGNLDSEQRSALHQGVRDILDDLTGRQAVNTQVRPDPLLRGAIDKSGYFRILCLPVRATRDELAAVMLAHALVQQGLDAEALSTNSVSAGLVEFVEQRAPHAVCISVVTPSAAVHARNLCVKLRAQLPDLSIIVGMWGSTEDSATIAQSLRIAGTCLVVMSVGEAVAQLGKLAAESGRAKTSAQLPAGDESVFALPAQSH